MNWKAEHDQKARELSETRAKVRTLEIQKDDLFRELLPYRDTKATGERVALVKTEFEGFVSRIMAEVYSLQSYIRDRTSLLVGLQAANARVLELHDRIRDLERDLEELRDGLRAERKDTDRLGTSYRLALKREAGTLKRLTRSLPEGWQDKTARELLTEAGKLGAVMLITNVLTDLLTWARDADDRAKQVPADEPKPCPDCPSESVDAPCENGAGCVEGDR